MLLPLPVAVPAVFAPPLPPLIVLPPFAPQPDYDFAAVAAAEFDRDYAPREADF